MEFDQVIENTFEGDCRGKWSLELARDEHGRMSYSVSYGGYMLRDGRRRYMWGCGKSEDGLEEAVLAAWSDAERRFDEVKVQPATEISATV